MNKYIISQINNSNNNNSELGGLDIKTRVEFRKAYLAICQQFRRVYYPQSAIERIHIGTQKSRKTMHTQYLYQTLHASIELTKLFLRKGQDQRSTQINCKSICESDTAYLIDIAVSLPHNIARTQSEKVRKFLPLTEGTNIMWNLV